MTTKELLAEVERLRSENARLQSTIVALLCSHEPIKIEEKPDRFASLTKRQKDVLSLILGAWPNKMIAHKLGLSQRTVEIHRAALFKKVGVKSAVELARVAAEVGWKGERRVGV